MARCTFAWLALLMLGALGCPPKDDGPAPAASGSAVASTGSLRAPVLDGRFEDWPASADVAKDPAGDAEGPFDITRVQARAIGTRLFVRFDCARPVNLVSGPDDEGTLLLVVDLPDGQTLRLDLRRRRARVGSKRLPNLQAVGFVSSPTHAGTSFELGVDLAPWSAAPGRSVTLRFEGRDEVAPATLTFEPQGEGPPPRSPARPAGALRVASLNTYEGGFADRERQPRFARLVGAVAPDVLCLQELGETAASQVAAVLERADGATWNVHHRPMNRIIGNAVASRHPVVPLSTPSPRLTAAVVETTPPIAVVSVHLTCCGHRGSEQDRARLAEADHLLALQRDLRAGPYRDAPLIVVGDFNDVGTEALGERLERRGLTAHPLPHLTTDARYTWRSPTSSFPPGILDRLFVTRGLPTSGFILDSTALTAPTRTQLGLHPDDSRASDHLMLVADVVVR